MEKTNKDGFTVIEMVEIPSSYLPKEIKSHLFNRELYVDLYFTESIYNADIFSIIEQEELNTYKGTRMAMSKEGLAFVKKLARKLKKYELIRITNF